MIRTTNNTPRLDISTIYTRVPMFYLLTRETVDAASSVHIYAQRSTSSAPSTGRVRPIHSADITKT